MTFRASEVGMSDSTLEVDERFGDGAWDELLGGGINGAFGILMVPGREQMSTAPGIPT